MNEKLILSLQNIFSLLPKGSSTLSSQQKLPPDITTTAERGSKSKALAVFTGVDNKTPSTSSTKTFTVTKKPLPKPQQQTLKSSVLFEAGKAAKKTNKGKNKSQTTPRQTRKKTRDDASTSTSPSPGKLVMALDIESEHEYEFSPEIPLPSMRQQIMCEKCFYN